MLKVIYSGNLTADAELVESNGSTRCQFSVAANTSVMENGKPKVQFPRVTVWGKRGESCAQYLKKGNYVSGTGDLVLSEFVGRDGEKHLSININNADVEFGPRNQKSEPAPADDDDDIFND